MLVSENELMGGKSAISKDGYHNPETAEISVKVYYSQDVLDFHKGKVNMVKKDVSPNLTLLLCN